jgi:hypothetical protein
MRGHVSRGAAAHLSQAEQQSGAVIVAIEDRFPTIPSRHHVINGSRILMSQRSSCQDKNIPDAGGWENVQMRHLSQLLTSIIFFLRGALEGAVEGSGAEGGEWVKLKR